MSEERPVIRRKVTTDITRSVTSSSSTLASTPTPTSRSSTPILQRPTVSRPPSRTRYDSPGINEQSSTPKARVNLASISTPSSSTRTPTRSSLTTPTTLDSSSSSPNVTTRKVRSPVPAITPSIGQRVAVKATVTSTPTTTRQPGIPFLARVRSAGPSVPSPRLTPPATITASGAVYRQASAPVAAKSSLTKQATSPSNSELATSPSSGSSLSRQASESIRVNVYRSPTVPERERSYDEASIWLDANSYTNQPSALTIPRPTHERRNSSNHLQLEADALHSFEPSSFEDRITIPTQLPSAVPPHLRSPTTHISAPNSPSLDGPRDARGGHPMQHSLTPDLKTIKLAQPRPSGGYMTSHPPPLPLPPSSPNSRCAPLPDVDGDDGFPVISGLDIVMRPLAPTPSISGSEEEDGYASGSVSDDETREQGEDDVATEAKVNRKVQDLEISNGSLLALNNSLEAANAQYRLEIRRLRRLTRAGSSGVATPERRGHQRSTLTQPQVQSDSEEEKEIEESESDDGFALDRHAQSEVVLDRLVALVDVMRTRAGRSLEERGYSAGLRVLGPAGEARS